MKVLDKAGVFGALAILAPALGCASRAVPPPVPTFRPPLVSHASAVSPAAAHGAQGWALPQGWEAPQAWALPQGWAVPQGWAPPPAAWPFPWPGPQPPSPQKPTPSPTAAPGAPAAIAYARSRIGTPYCWGGNGPTCYDCSGLTSRSWKAGGKTIPRTSEAQAEELPAVPLDKIVPGDILWRPGHVALYVGDGQVIHAPRTGDIVKYAPATKFVKAVRP